VGDAAPATPKLPRDVERGKGTYSSKACMFAMIESGLQNELGKGFDDAKCSKGGNERKFTWKQ
jgi:hypothetical protein